MRALITGITGFAGSFLAEYCLGCAGVQVVGLVRNRTRLTHAASFASHITLVEADLRDAVAVDRAVAAARPEMVFHLAAQAFVPQSFADPVGTLLDNAVGQLHVIQAMLRHCPAARLLAVGSATEYGMVQPEENPVDERVLLRPADPYAVSKVTQDLQAYQYFVSHGLQAVRVRAFNHTGPRQEEAFVASRFAREVARIEAGLAPPELTVGNLTAIREFTDVRDVVRAYFLAGTQGEPGEVYNVGSGDGRRIQEVLDLLASLSRVPFTVREDPSLLRPVDVPALVCDASRLRERCGWQPQIPLERTLRDLLDYWRARVITVLAAAGGQP
jgi:GDP-4-dehydro-6-deoxy-D-mannose reductase